MPPSDNISRALRAAFLSLAVFITLFVLRPLDDNSLTRWQWVFDSVDASPVYLAVLAGTGLSLWLSRFPLPGPGLLFLVSFAMSAVFWGEPEVIVDSSRYFTQAKHLEVFGAGYYLREWGGAIEAWTDMPLVPFIYGLVFKAIGESRICIQALNSALFSLTAVLALLIGRGRFGEEAGRAAGMLMLAMPYLYSQTPLMLVDVPSMFFLALAIWSFQRALEQGGATIVFSGLATAAAMLSKYSLWPMLSILPVMLAVQLYGSKNRGAVLRRAASAMAIAGVLSGAFIVYKYDVVAGQIKLLTGFQKEGLTRWTESYISTFLFQVHPFVTFGALLSLYTAVKKRDYGFFAVAWLPLLVFLMQLKRIRYTVPVFPMFAVAAAYGVCYLRDERLKRFVVLAAATTSLAVAAFGYLPFLKGLDAGNLMDAGHYLNTLKADRVKVYALPQDGPANPAVAVPLLDLYTDKEIAYAYGTGQYTPPEDYLKSPLRFTWHYRNPGYYEREGPSSGEEAVAIIAGEKGAAIPDTVLQEIGGCRSPQAFDKGGFFRYKTFVTVCP